MSKTVDLSTLPGWLALTVGSHTVTVIAKADGYRDSEASAGVTVEKNGSILLLGTNCTLLAKVTRSGKEVTLAHGDPIYLGEEIKWTATAAVGYHMAEGDDAGTLVANSTAFGGKATIKIEKSAIANQYTVSGNLAHLTLSNTAKATPTEAYVTTLLPDTGYHCPEKSAVSVTIGGTAYTGFAYSQKSDGSAQLTIPQGAVTGDVVIAATGLAKAYTVSITTEHAKNPYVSTVRLPDGTVQLMDGDTVYYGETVQYYATAEPGYVTEGGDKTISGSLSVSDNVSIEMKFPTHATYTVTAHMTGLTFSGATTATHGTAYTATINPSGNVDLPDTIEMTVGGSAYTGFTWNAASGILTVPGNAIVGNLEITAAAIPPRLSKPLHVSVSGKQLSFDAVTGATTYDILVDGTSIGTVEA